MSTKNIIILLGNTNDDSGLLSHISRLRCKIAVQLFNKNNDCIILPTGGFGSSFNKTNSPHYSYLKKRLTDLNIPEDKILKGIDSKGTFQDLLMARGLLNRMIKTNINLNKVFLVTSEYHKERVAFISNKILNNFDYIVVTEKDFSNITISNEAYSQIQIETKIEKEKMRSELENWVDIPFDLEDFPQAIYDNASAEHKHYDTISIALISAIIVIGGATITFNNNFKLLLISSLLNFVIFSMYLRAAKIARLARRVMIFLELSYERQGFSLNYQRKAEHWKFFRFSTWGFKQFASLIFIFSLIPIFFAIYSIFFKCS